MLNDKEETKNLYNGLRWFCPTFWTIYSQWGCKFTLHALHMYEQSVHPLHWRWTPVWTLVRQMNETKDLYNGLRWSCHSFCKIYGQWCGSYHLRALYLYEQPVHPIFGRWTSLSVSNDKEEMKDLYNGLRWACPTFWKIYGQWCCSCHLRALHPHEQAVHPIFGRWTSVFVSNDKEEMKNLYNGLRWSCPTFCKIYSQCYCSCPLHAL